MSPLRQLWLAGVVLAWCGVAAWGLREMFAHETTPGATTAAPAHWPADSRLPRGTTATIAMFVHPQCPCSRASLQELAAITLDGTTTLAVVVSGPEVEGALWDAAGQIPRAVRIIDDGREAARFGALTSGYTVVYDGNGVRRFAGGVTGSRGHVGDNVGRDAIQQILRGGSNPRPEHPVFGCALADGP